MSLNKIKLTTYKSMFMSCLGWPDCFSGSRNGISICIIS